MECKGYCLCLTTGFHHFLKKMEMTQQGTKALLRYVGSSKDAITCPWKSASSACIPLSFLGDVFPMAATGTPSGQSGTTPVTALQIFAGLCWRRWPLQPRSWRVHKLNKVVLGLQFLLCTSESCKIKSLTSKKPWRTKIG